MLTANDPTTTETPPPPFTLWRGKLWFWVPIPILVALDLLSKSAVFAHVAQNGSPIPGYDGRRIDVIEPGWFGFSLVQWRNNGTIWGLFQDSTTPLMVLRCAALFLLIWFARKTPPGRRLQLLVLGLIFAGAVGNLYDNFFMEDRAVRDFLLFFYQSASGELYQFPAFNVADSCISVGAIALALLMWQQPAPQPVAGRPVGKPADGMPAGGLPTGGIQDDGKAGGGAAQRD